MTLFEVNEVAERIGAAIDDAADIIFGAVIDPTLGDTMRVTLIAAGMEELHTTRIEAIHREPTPPPPVQRPGRQYAPDQQAIGQRSNPPYPAPAQQSGAMPPSRPAPSPMPYMPPAHPASLPVSPPPTQMPPSVRPGNGGTAGRQQRSLNDLRGLRSMGRRQEGR